ncbi:tetratricopeptide repeat protein, partial [bacterium]|nr:tetratricopeptide repeat protein [candidate division CSSED10-310 bacterium]
INRDQDSDLRFPIPASLDRFLVRCLQDNPKNRWKSMAEAAGALIGIFSEITGRPYDRTAPEGTMDIGRPLQPYSRITATGYVWADPEKRLRKACEANEIPCPVLPRFTGNRRDRILADLEILEDAESLFKKLPEMQILQYLDEMIAVIADKSIVLMELHDYPGAIQHYEEAIEWVTENRALTEPKKTVLLLELYKRKADTLLTAHCFPEAVEMYRLVRSLFSERTDIPDTQLLLSIRIRSGVNLAYTLYFLGKTSESLKISTELLNEMITPAYHERVDMADVELGTLHLNRGLAFWQRGQLTEALQEYDAALDLQRRPHYQAKAPDAVTDLAKTLSNKALILHSLGRFEEAECSLLEAILLIEKQLLEGTRSDLAGVLSVFYINIAGIYLERDAWHLGLRYVKKAKELLNRNVHLEGVREFENQISRMLMFEASCMAGLGKVEQAVLKIDQAVALLERLVFEFNRGDLQRELASCFVHRAIIMEAAGRLQEASESVNQTFRLRQRFAMESETGDLQDTLLIAQCIDSRVRLRSGITTDGKEISDLISLVEKELAKTFKLKLRQQVDQMRSVLRAFDAESASPS